MADNQTSIQPGSRVRLRFSLRLEDGTEVDSTGDGDDLEFVMGDGSLSSGLEMALLGMAPGDHETVRIGPELSGFGERADEAVQTLPRSDFPEGMELAPGLLIAFETPAGDEVPGAIRAVDTDSITVDLNHPLAGHELTFEVEIREVQPPADGQGE